MSIEPFPIHGVNSFPSIGFVRLPTVLSVYPVGASTWWRMVRMGHAPKPVKLGPGTTAWRCEDIRAFIEEKGKAATPQS